MASWTRIRYPRLDNGIFAGLISCLILFLGVKGHQLLLMRPVSDDYCFAASLNRGALGSITYWYQSVQFDFFVLSSNLIFVGVPIRLLSPAYASVGSFIVMTSLFIFFVWRLLIPKSQVVPSGRNFKIISFLTCALLAYFFFQPSLLVLLQEIFFENTDSWSSFFTRVTQHAVDVSNSWLFWGVVNSSYLVPFILSFSFLWNINLFGRLKLKQELFVALLIGTAGYVIAATTLISIVCIHVGSSGALNKNFRLSTFWILLKSMKIILPVSLSILLGACLSYFSPGGAERRNALKALPENAQGSLGSLLPDAGRVFGEVFLNIGNLVVLLFGVLIAMSLGKMGNLSVIRVKKISDYSFVYLVTCFFMTVISEFFSYRAYWHTFTLKFVLFVFLISWGIRLQFASRVPCLKTGSILVVLPIIFLFSLIGVSTQSANRYDSWIKGSSYGAISSISIQSGWVHSCFIELKSSNPAKYYEEVNQ
jgi:hypothetical protein